MPRHNPKKLCAFRLSTETLRRLDEIRQIWLTKPGVLIEGIYLGARTEALEMLIRNEHFNLMNPPTVAPPPPEKKPAPKKKTKPATNKKGKKNGNTN
jgi:hypothetical protein